VKICRFDDDRIGVVEGDRVIDVTLALALVLVGGVAPWPLVIATLAGWRAETFADCPSRVLADVTLRAPAYGVGKIIAAPVNYAAHVREMEAAGLLAAQDSPQILEAGLFLKANSSLAGPADGIALRFPDRRTDFEVELVALIGRTASEVSAAAALDHVAGYCLGLDVTLRGPEDRSFRKSIDGYSVIGPWLVTADELGDPQSVRLSLRQNRMLRQDSLTSDMVLGVAELIAFASTFYTLQPGDLLFTGTPAGVGPLRAGDELRAESPQIGAMRVAVRGQ
jgi:2-keto-4-pentenoate hydratase/2-oxohepta-3-ene-1,7-dioic acid hydratase in catechol pathway